MLFLKLFDMSNFLIKPIVDYCSIALLCTVPSPLIACVATSSNGMAFLNTLKCKLDSTNGGTFSNSAEQVILIFFLFQRALVMSKLVREYKILTTSHPEMSNGQFHCFHYGTPPKGTKTTQTQTLKRLVKINFFRK